MRKSKDISKYDIDWQMVRAKVKGQKTPFDDKLKIVKDFWTQYPTLDNQERILNWLEGLRMGYIASHNNSAINSIDKEMENYKNEVTSKKEEDLTDQEQIDKIKKYDFDSRLGLWKDLFKRNENWLEKSYNHKEHNHFMDLLWLVFRENKEESDIPEEYDSIKLYKLRKAADKKENTHKFFF